ncbi:transposase [Bradyrhizobium sp. USDA 3650]
MDKANTAIRKPVRWLEVFTGAGCRRKWRDEGKALIVAEIVASGASVCSVARRRGLSLQQLFCLAALVARSRTRSFRSG